MPPPPAAAAAAAANDMEERVRRAYVTPGHPVAYSAPAAVARHFGISRHRAKTYLQGIESYGLHREYKQPKHYNPYYVHNRRKQVQGDLIDIAKISSQNGGVKFLLLLIDIFTKKVWVYPLRDKSGPSVKRVLTTWLLSLAGQLPEILKTDRGREFIARPVQQLLAAHGVEWQPASGTLKAAIAERANKTLQILIYKYLTENETLRYLDKLPALVRTYNKRPHRSLGGLTPAAADLPENEARVQATFHERYAKLAALRRQNLPLKVGQLVRVKTEAKKISSSARAYALQFHGEYFRIIRINRTLPVAMYYLSSLDTGEHIEGGFYANELQPQKGDVFRIESVLGRRRRRGRREILVKWRYFGPRWNEWIPETDLRRVF